MIQKISTITSVLLFLAIPHERAVGQNDEELKKQFLSEAPRKWKELSLLEQNVSGTIHLKTFAKGKGTNPNWGMNRRYDFKRRGELIALTVQNEGFPNADVVTVGKSYAFRLSKDTKNSPFRLNGISWGPPKDELEIIKKTYFYRAIQSYRELWNLSLDELLLDPGFILKGVSAAPSDSKKFVRIDFECDSKKYFPGQKWMKAWATLDPAENWMIQQAEFRPSEDLRISIQNDFVSNRTQAHHKKLSYPLHQYTMIKHYEKANVTEHHVFTIKKLKNEQFDDSVFTLSAFGLPEPSKTDVATRASRIHYWFIAAALLLFAAAILLRIFSRRRNRTLSTTCLWLAVFILTGALLSLPNDSHKTERPRSLCISPSIVQVGPIELYDAKTISFRIMNPDPNRRVRLIGVEDGCDSSTCIAIKGIPSEIPPGRAIILEAQFYGTKSGPFARDVPFYTDTPGQFSLVVSVKGEVVPKKSPTPHASVAHAK